MPFCKGKSSYASSLIWLAAMVASAGTGCTATTRVMVADTLTRAHTLNLRESAYRTYAFHVTGAAGPPGPDVEIAVNGKTTVPSGAGDLLIARTSTRACGTCRTSRIATATASSVRGRISHSKHVCVSGGIVTLYFAAIRASSGVANILRSP